MNVMKQTTTILNVLFLCLLAGSPTTAHAQRPIGGGGSGQGGPGQGGPGVGMFIERVARLLDLTEAQKAQIKTIQDEAASASRSHQQQLAPLFAQMQTLIDASPFDETAARALGAQVSTIQVEIHLIQARAEWAIVHNVLTAEQRAKLAELRQAMQNGGGRPGGGRP